MGSFTKKRFKTGKEWIKGLKKGDFSLRKKEFSIKKTVKTVKLISSTASDLKEKVDELKEVHHEIFDSKKDEPEEELVVAEVIIVEVEKDEVNN